MSSDLTPMMRQYLEIKEQCPDAILFFRLGDFYEMFFDDALEATRILHITLTSRGNLKGKKVPMCGVPHHAANNYIARLIMNGRKVAVCEQVEEPSDTKKIVRREITKVITPGTFIADEILSSSVNNYILSLAHRDGVFGLAYSDISTGEFRVTEIDGRERLFSEIYKISPSESLVSASFSSSEDFKKFKEANLGAVTVNDDWMFDSGLAADDIKRHFAVKTLEAFGCHDMDLGLGAAGALIKYLKSTQKTQLKNIDSIRTYRAVEYMTLDRVSHRHLELIQNQEDLSSHATLYDVLDFSKTPMGKRKLKRWMLNPLLDTRRISDRLDAVQYFHDENTARSDFREIMGRMYDIERLANKVSLGTANARDMLALAGSLENIPHLKKSLTVKTPEALGAKVAELEDFGSTVMAIKSCIVEDPPVALREGGLIRQGYSPEVDEVRETVTRGRDWLMDLQLKEIERTGISSLKVGYNKVFGYYIEVTKANLENVPDDYIRKQTLVNAERFITQALKDEESRIIGAEERIKDLEYEVFCRLREDVAGRIEDLKKAADIIARLDVLSALGEAAVKNRYARPEVNTGNTISIKEGRHPVLERMLKDKEFVSNDCVMDDENNRIFIITGSNMAGKSTFIRQVALITIMAQIGSFVPATEAKIGVIDRIFTRVGASDRLYQGMSTFMVEMLETANILNNATERSLVVLDEIGRGTSTFDGVSIAWAVVEYIHHNLKGARTMFATHYHELTELSEVMKGVRNYNLAVQQWGDEIVFLYKVIEGSCDESFGIHVAKLAGMPSSVVERAKEILDNLQKDSFTGNIKARFADEKDAQDKQLDFFGGFNMEHPVIEKIKGIDPKNMTPMEALRMMEEFKREVSEK
jgi:DNA mismatch repair protein MutS